MASTAKECRRCGARDRYASGRCRPCTLARQREHAATGKRAEYMRAWKARNRDRLASYQRKSRYGISAEQYEQMLKQQGGVCAICGREESARHHKSGCVKRLAVDHDHESGNVRGLLCHRCNRVLGLLEENRDLLAQMSAYLECNEPLR